MSKPKKKSHAGRRGYPKSTCLDRRPKDTANASFASSKLRPISEAEFDFFISGAALHWYGVRLTSQAEVDALRCKFARSVNLPEKNENWAPVMERAIELMRAMGGDLNGRC